MWGIGGNEARKRGGGQIMRGLMCQIKIVEIEGEDAMELKKVVLKKISYYS